MTAINNDADPIGFMYNFMNPERWMDDALCRDHDPEIFFPGEGGAAWEGKRICSECPVRQDCLQYALRTDERHGIWGGLCEKDRRRLHPPEDRKSSAREKYCSRGHNLEVVGTYSDGRCKPCKLKLDREYRRRQDAAGVNWRGRNSPHGSYSRYRGGCRCPECREANAECQREYQARKRLSHKFGV